MVRGPSCWFGLVRFRRYLSDAKLQIVARVLCVLSYSAGRDDLK